MNIQISKCAVENSNDQIIIYVHYCWLIAQEDPSGL